MELQTEWNEFLGLLSRHGVRFVIVGGLAVAAHGRERYTKDLDVLVDTSQANARRLGRALAEFGFATTARAWQRFQRPYQILTLGREPLRIDVLTSITGVSFRDVWKGREIVDMTIGRIPVIGLRELRINKSATGRAIDLGDLALLDELQRVEARSASRPRRTRRRPAKRKSRKLGTRPRG